jgi:hypothetical protein
MNDIAKRDVLYEAPAADALTVRHEGDIDIYSPAGSSGPLPAVVIVAGYRDEGFLQFVGCRFKEMQSVVSWARLIAASGLNAITYTNRDPAADVFTVLRVVRETISPSIGVWASSGNVPVALSTLGEVKCAALCYGYMLDAEDAAATYKFANPCAGRTIDDLRADVPTCRCSLPERVAMRARD